MKDGEEGKGGIRAYFQFSNLCIWIVGGALLEIKSSGRDLGCV